MLVAVLESLRKRGRRNDRPGRVQIEKLGALSLFSVLARIMLSGVLLEKNLLFASSAGNSEVMYDRVIKEKKMTEKRFRSVYQDWAYGGRRIISRDRAWLEFVPKGESPPEQHMFQHATLLESNDAEIEKQLQRDWRDEVKSIDASKFDVYYVYRTTTG